MKIAFHIEEGREQVILTPESEHERDILAKVHDAKRITRIKRGSFYQCQGGWTRHGTSDDSTILVIEPKDKPE